MSGVLVKPTFSVLSFFLNIYISEKNSDLCRTQNCYKHKSKFPKESDLLFDLKTGVFLNFEVSRDWYYTVGLRQNDPF